MQSGHWVFSSLVILLAIIAAPCAGWAEGGIVFGEPVVVEPGLGPVPVGDFRNETYAHFAVKSSNQILILQGNPNPGAWSMVRLTLNGELIDTIPRQMRQADHQYVGSTYALTWAAPYYYLWEGGGGSIYYTRITEDLTVVDAPARQLAPSYGSVSFGGSQVWKVIGDDTRTVVAYDAESDSMIVPPTQIPGWRYLSGVATSGLVSNGYYVARSNPLDTQIEYAHISIQGQVTPIAPGRSHPWPRGKAHYSGDSAVFFQLVDNTLPETLRYYFLSPSDSLSSIELHEITFPGGDLGFTTSTFVTNKKAVLIGRVASGSYHLFAATVDLEAETLLVAPHLLGFASPLWTGPGVGSPVAVFNGDSCHAILTWFNGLRVVTLTGPSFETATDRGPVLYGAGLQGQPTVMTDSTGITAYAVIGTDRGTQLQALHWSDWSAEGLANPLCFVPDADDSDAYAPTLLPFDGGTGLYWLERLDDSMGIGSKLYEQRLAVISGSVVSKVEMETSHRLDTSLYSAYYYLRHSPPSAVRIRDSLYVIAGGTGEDWYLKCIDLVSGTSAPGQSTGHSIAPPLLFNHFDTLVRWGEFYSCVEDCGNLGCCIFSRYAYCREYWNGSSVAYWQEALPDLIEYDGPSLALGSHVIESDGRRYIALTERPCVLELDLANHAMELRANIKPLLTAPEPHFEGLELFPAMVSGYRLVLALRSDGLPHDAFIFDADWNLMGRSRIPTLGSVDDIGGVVPIPGTDTLLLVYTAWLPYPYSSERLIVQKVWLDLATDIDPDVPLLPGTFAVKQNYPNPFNAGTIIEFSLPQRTEVTLEVFNILGQIIRTWGPEEYGPGVHTIEWDGRDDRHRMASTGVYLYRVSTSEGSEVRKMLLLK